MSETNQEPTMEEILASIRRIISEDDAPADAEADAAPAAQAGPLPELEPLPAIGAMADDGPLMLDEEDVLELTDRLDDPMDTPEALAMSDLEFVEPALPPRADISMASLAPVGDDEPLVGASASYAAASAFAALDRNVMMPDVGRTLEDVVREMLRPMLKAWLDENLPSIVEAQVQAEVERIARQRR